MSEPASAQQFTHLRLHTEFSISDGLVTIGPLVDRLRELQMPAVAITDLANLFALIKFYSTAMGKGIKPVCGCDVLVESENGSTTALVLLVQNETGYLNLTNLISDMYTRAEGHAEPMLRRADMAGRTEGLIALSGAQRSDIGEALLAGDNALARSQLQAWQDLFPDDCFYLELQRVGKANEEAYIAAAVALALETDIPVVATNDVRFLQQDDFEAHEVRVCINDRRTLDDPRRPRNYTDQQYLKSAEEMQSLFADIP
ncbi:MAG: PHP domain-containing protein, partial [Pseudomonadales bacterium]|nr:PHP domain-containing protein [Pseudomonadales bacterium]